MLFSCKIIRFNNGRMVVSEVLDSNIPAMSMIQTFKIFDQDFLYRNLTAALLSYLASNSYQVKNRYEEVQHAGLPALVNHFYFLQDLFNDEVLGAVIGILLKKNRALTQDHVLKDFAKNLINLVIEALYLPL